MNKTVFNLLKSEREKIYCNTRMVVLRIPSILKTGENFSLHISVVDNNGLPDETFSLPLFFEADDMVQNLPKVFELPKKSKGLFELKGLTAKYPGILRITAKIKYCEREIKIVSNPCRVMDYPEYRIFWGDMHVHSILGTCQVHETKDPELAYLYARDVSHHDFLAVTDHIYGLTPEKWKTLKNLVKKYDRPGEFSAILAYESSHSSGLGGDNNVYFSGKDGRVFPMTRETMRTEDPPVTALWKFLKKGGGDYITVPHHTARKEKYRDFDIPDYNRDKEPVFEIYSMWGCSERKLNQYNFWRDRSDKSSYFQDALIRGCKYGVIASGDDHTTMSGSQLVYAAGPFGSKINRSPHAGTTAILAKKNTVKDIFTALRSRSCYGTTFEKTLLDFDVNEHMQGETITVNPNSAEMKKRTIKINISDCSAGNPMGRVTVIRNNKTVCVFELDKPDGEFIFEDKEPLNKLFIKKSLFNPKPFVYYYVRYDKRASNETAWSSPVWLEER